MVVRISFSGGALQRQPDQLEQRDRRPGQITAGKYKIAISYDTDHQSIKHPKDRLKPLCVSVCLFVCYEMFCKAFKPVYIQKAEDPQKHLSLHTPAKTLFVPHMH